MGVWDWYRSLSPRARILLGGGVMAYASIALVISDNVEDKYGLKATEKDKEELKKALPRISTIEKGEWERK